MSLAAPGDPEVLKREPYYLSLHPAEGQAQGTVLLLHGGGWQGDLGPAADELMKSSIEALREWGYDVANLGYRGGAQGLNDATAAFDLLRREAGRDERICIYGTSAGAQLGLMVAAERGDVDCVVDLLGPPNLESFGATARSERGETLAELAFGPGRLAEVSPLRNAGRIDAPVLVGAASCDQYIEVADQRRFVRSLNSSGGEGHLVEIAEGDDVDLEHCIVDQRSFDRFQAATRSLLAGDTPEVVAEDPVPPDEGPAVPWALVVAALVFAAGGFMFFRALHD